MMERYYLVLLDSGHIQAWNHESECIKNAGLAVRYVNCIVISARFFILHDCSLICLFLRVTSLLFMVFSFFRALWLLSVGSICGSFAAIFVFCLLILLHFHECSFFSCLY